MLFLFFCQLLLNEFRRFLRKVIRPFILREIVLIKIFRLLALCKQIWSILALLVILVIKLSWLLSLCGLSVLRKHVEILLIQYLACQFFNVLWYLVRLVWKEFDHFLINVTVKVDGCEVIVANACILGWSSLSSFDEDLGWNCFSGPHSCCKQELRLDWQNHVSDYIIWVLERNGFYVLAIDV